MSDPSLLQRLKERKLVQWAVAYSAAAWVFYEVTATVGGHWNLSDGFFQGLSVVLVIGFLATLLFAWYHGEKGRQRVSGPELLLIALLLGIAGLLLATVGTRSRGGDTPSGYKDGNLPPSLGPKSLAVLPCENLSSDPERGFFADAIHEEILTQLLKIGGLSPISRTSVMEYRDSRPNLRQIAEELGVENILECSVFWAGNQVKITAQLIGAQTDEHLWADTYERPLEDVFAIQTEVARSIAMELQVELSTFEDRELNRIPTENMEAYTLFLSAGSHWTRHPDSLSRAEEILLHAVDIDPSFALAYASLSRVYSRAHRYTEERTEENASRARMYAERSLEMAPDLPEAHEALGYYYYMIERDYEGALSEYQIARAVRPNDSELLLVLGYITRRQGRLEEAAEVLQQALTFDPRSEPILVALEEVYRRLHRPAEIKRIVERNISIRPTAFSRLSLLYHRNYGDTALAREVFTEGCATYPQACGWGRGFALDLASRDYAAALEWIPEGSAGMFPQPGVVSPYAEMRGMVLRLLGQEEAATLALDSARVLLEESIEDSPEDMRLLGALGRVHARLGNRTEALRAAQAAVSMMPVSRDILDGTHALTTLALTYAILNEADLAMDALEQLFSLPAYLTVHELRIDPAWDPLRDHPRFQALLEEYADDVEH